MRILVADDQPKVRFAIRVLLERHPGFKTVSEASDAADLLAQARSVCPDLVLLDWDLPGMPAVDLTVALRQICPTARVVVLSEKPEAREAAIAAGADAFVCKCDPPEQLRLAIGECCKTSQRAVAPKAGEQSQQSDL